MHTPDDSPELTPRTVRPEAPRYPFTFDGEKPEGGGDGAGEKPDWEAKAKTAEAEAEKWKALSRKNEANAKDATAALAKLKDLEDKEKSEVQKLTEREAAARKTAEDSEARATKAELEVLRIRVAASKGLTPGQAERLLGTTEEELTADADKLVAAFKPAPPPPPPGRRPITTLKPGGGGDEEETEETDPAKLAGMIPRV